MPGMILFLTWLFLLGPPNAFAAPSAQNPAASPVEGETGGTEAGEPGAAYPGPSEIIPRQSQLNEQAARALSEVKALSEVAPFRKQLEQARQRKEALDRRFDQLGDLQAWSVERLLDVRAMLDEQRTFLKKLLDEVSAPMAELDALRRAWQGRREFWSGWAEALRAPEAQLPMEIFGEARRTIDGVLQEITTASEGLIALQKEVTTLQETNLERLKRVEEPLAALRREIFQKTAPSFANPAFYRQFDDRFREQLRSGLRQLAEPSAAYLQNRGWVLLAHGLITLLLAVWIRRHRFDTEVSREWQFSLRHPWATGLFVGAVALSYLYGTPPGLWRLVLWGVTVVAGSLLVAGMLEHRRKVVVVIFLAILFLVALGMQAVGLPQPLYRIYLALAAVVGVPVLLRAAALEKRAREGRLGFFGTALRAGSLLLLVVLVAQSGGYTIFAARLFEASLETVFLGLFTSMAVLLFRGAVEYLLSRRGLRRSRFVRRAGSELARRLKNLVDTLLIGYALFYLMVIWGVYDSLEQAWEEILGLGFEWGEVYVSLQTVLLAVLVIYLVLILSWALRSVLEWEVFPRKGMDRGVRDAIKKLLHYSLVFLGFLLAVSLAGIDLKSFAVIAGALGLGIGFGLQNIVNNFVSGIILLFERPVKVGDMVVLDGEWGTIRKIGLRSTVVETFDQSEIIVPNSDLVSQKVTNWTLSTKMARVVLAVGVAYGSDVEKVLKILFEVGSGHRLAVADPPVSPIFVGFGESSLDFELRVWIADISERLTVRSELGREVDRRFREEGVEIPFPQRDLHLRSVSGGVLERMGKGGSPDRDVPLPGEERDAGQDL